jgi:hypothetical protein
MNDELQQHMNDFISAVRDDIRIRTGNIALPIKATMEDVEEKQNRPSQRRILDTAKQFAKFKGNYNNFIKRETYTSLGKPPRPICTTHPTIKLAYSRYTYAISKLLKVLPWYAFSKPVGTVARTVASLAKECKYMTETDYTMMDGSHSVITRTLWRQFIMPLFRDDQELTYIMDKMTDQTIYGRHGNKINSGQALASGSPDTSAFNTFTNAFVVYLSHRLNNRTPSEAYARLGIYGGDDGISPDLPPKFNERAASMVGFVLKAETVNRNSGKGFAFLSRNYLPTVFDGNPNSFCTGKRTLTKFFVTADTTRAATQPKTLLVEKSAAYYLTDANTPIIGDLCRKVKEICERTGVSFSVGKECSYRATEQKHYPNDLSSIDREYATQVFQNECKYLNITTCVQHIKVAKTLDDLLNIPNCDTNSSLPPIKRPCTIIPQSALAKHNVQRTKGDRQENDVKERGNLNTIHTEFSKQHLDRWKTAEESFNRLLSWDTEPASHNSPSARTSPTTRQMCKTRRH